MSRNCPEARRRTLCALGQMRRRARHSDVDYAEFEPSEALRPWVRCYWSLSADASNDAPPADPALPDGSPELIFNLADPFEAHPADGAPVRQPLVMLVGQITGPFPVSPTGRIDLLAVRLESYGAAPWSANVAELNDRWLGPAELGAELTSLLGALQAEPLTARRIARTESALLEIAARAPIADARVIDAVARIRATRGHIPLAELARTLRTTTRTLQRLFVAQVGLSPKALARIVRFQQVFDAWRTAPSSLSTIAAECGYFDQSHLVRDFKDFAGSAPSAFLASQPEFTAFFTERGTASRSVPTDRVP